MKNLADLGSFVALTDPALTAALLQPDALLSLHASNPARYPVLLQSAASNDKVGRFDVLMAFPGEHLRLAADGRLQGRAETPGFLSSLDRWFGRCRVAQAHQQNLRLPFTGGWFLFLSYELASEMEPHLRLPQSTGVMAEAIRIPAAIVCCRSSSRAWIVAEAEQAELAQQIAFDVENLQRRTPFDGPVVDGPVEEDAPELYLNAVERALDYIRAGDIYQTNLSRGWRAKLSVNATPHDVYRRLCRANAAPFAGLAALGHTTIVSSSPERLIEVRNGQASTRPIAGTRPRARDLALDRELALELHAHPKERAEHTMLIDLERNDLGRVCRAGSVEVDEFMSIESYAHVHHIVSNVRGHLRDEVTPAQCIAAVFPGGTITGCPKVRCMEIIGELEGAPRGAYTGSMGYLNRDGSLDLNILIRTLEIKERQIAFRAGAGIVADSNPERELDETRVKARGLVHALTGEGAR